MLDLVGNPNCWFCHAQAHLNVNVKVLFGREVTMLCNNDE